MTAQQRLTLAEVRAINRGGHRHHHPDPDDNPAAAALLAEGRVDVITKTRRQVLVDVEGRTGRYRIEANALGWSCTCPGFHHRRRCSHLDAARLVVAGPGLYRLPPPAPATTTNPPGDNATGDAKP